MGEWTRCANTGFYRKQPEDHPLAWFYSNPVIWTYIVSIPRMGMSGTEGLMPVVRRKAPRYSWEMLRVGTQAIFEDKEERQEVLRYTHGWAADLARAQDLKLPVREQARIFENAPETLKDRVLEGVRALVVGYQEIALAENSPMPVNEQAILVVRRDSDAEHNLDDLEGTFPGFKRSIVTKDPARGLEEALSEFGIHEC